MQAAAISSHGCTTVVSYNIFLPVVTPIIAGEQGKRETNMIAF